MLDSPTPGIEQRIDRQLLSKDVLYAYSRDQVWCDRAQVRVKALRDLIDAWHQGDLLFRDRAPTPNTVLRLTPEV